MRALVAIELTKILHRRLNQIVLAVSYTLLVVIYVLLWLTSGVVAETGTAPEAVRVLRSTLFLKETVPFAILMLYSMGFVSGVVVIGSNVGSEYGWNTIRTSVAIEPRRERLLVAKLVTLWVVIVLALLGGLLLMLVTSGLITLAAGEFDLSFVDAAYIRESAYAFLRVLVATAPYFALATLFAIVGKSATAGIALSFGVAFLEGIVGSLMTLAGGWLAEIPPYMLDTNGDTLGTPTGGELGGLIGSTSAIGQAFERPTITHATVVMLCWAVVLFATAFWSFRRQDLEYQG